MISSHAFALNVGPELWQKESVTKAYAAALEMDTPFKLFLSFDMTLGPSFQNPCH